ncbi:MAG: RdgB/HAM1 family non-canonical purine NTP pyrophosphatase [Coriobacteriales bacterium]|nr:RdgB/HAM1 family non-canonical purine NTP pyrophosphatase [Coriobacteriales bacterium]
MSTYDPNRTVVVATGNAHKLSEIRTILSTAPGMEEMEFVSLGELGDFEEPVEDGETFFDNALIKARDALDQTGMRMAVADDSGLMVDALDGAPGIFSARFAGDHGNDAANNQKLLECMADVPQAERTARFHSSVVLVTRDEDGEEVLAGEGDCEGTIAYDQRGNNGFGYDPLFDLADIPGKRMAELEPDQKNAISHRRRALDDLVVKLS